VAGDGRAVTPRAALAALLGVLLGGLAAAEAPVDEREAEAVVDAVYEALLVEAAPQADEVVCLVVRRTVEGKEQAGDPADAHLARLQKDHANVRRGSACKRGRGQPAVETATGGKAVVFDIGPVEGRGDGTARTGGGFSRGGWGATESEYELVRKGGAWTVARTTRKRTI
jgi:hypothetical protein